MKELFSKVLHYVPFPAAAKNLVVSELPPSSRQHQDLSRRIGKLSKSKNTKNNPQRYHSNSHPSGRGWGWALSRLPTPNLTGLFFLFLPDKGIS